MGEVLTVSKVVGIIEDLLYYFTTVAYIIAIGAVIFSGIKMALSRGNETKFGEAKKMLLYSIIGMAIVFGIGVIINTIKLLGQNPSNILR